LGADRVKNVSHGGHESVILSKVKVNVIDGTEAWGGGMGRFLSI